MRYSAGLLVWRRRAGELEVLLGHPGGPFFARQDEGVWSIPKGEYGPEEEPLAAAFREFGEEIGLAPPEGEPLPLGDVRLRNAKRVVAWALEGDLDASAARSNLFEMQWPPRSGRVQSFPELDRAEWMGVERARRSLVAGQRPLLDRLVELVG